jgi:hypothetical protein
MAESASDAVEKMNTAGDDDGAEPMLPADLLLARELDPFFADPLGFVFFAFAWGVGELEDIEGPDVWQAATFADIGRSVAAGEPVREAIAAGHGIGKGAFAAMLMLWLMATRPNLAGVVTANTKTQLTGKTWRELQVWHNRLIPPLRAWFRWTATRYECRFGPKTWGLDAVPWSETRSEAFAGLHARDVLVLFDEASAIPPTIWDVAKGAMTTAGAMWVVLGNPTRNTGRFHGCILGRERHRWRSKQIDARTCRFTDKPELDRWVADYGEDSDFVRVRVRGQFPRASSRQLIGGDLVQAARARQVEPDPGAPLVLGVDVARFGDAKTVLAFRRGRDARSIPWRRLRGADAVTVAEAVADAIDRHKPDAVFIDGGGVGGPVVDILKAKGYRVRAVDFGSAALEPAKYYNRRTEIWCGLADWLPVGAIPDDDEVAADLTGPEYDHHPTDGRKMLESKREMERRGIASPDDGDAIALTFAERVARRDTRPDRPAVARSRIPSSPRGNFA